MTCKGAFAYALRLAPMYSLVAIRDIVFIPPYYRQCPVFGKLHPSTQVFSKLGVIYYGKLRPLDITISQQNCDIIPTVNL